MGGHKTSVYLSGGLAARWRASGVPLSELVRRGLEREVPDMEATVRRVVREELSARASPATVLAGEGAPGTAHVPQAADGHVPHVEVHAGGHTAHDGTAAAPEARRPRKPRAGAPPLLPPAGPPAGSTGPPGAKPAARGGEQSCPHRLPRGAWCKPCGQVKA